MASSGLEPEIFLLIAQRSNQLSFHVPPKTYVVTDIDYSRGWESIGYFQLTEFVQLLYGHGVD
jgi:hypothetical protein